MGEPAEPSAEDRKVMRELAAVIVESVAADMEMPLPLKRIWAHTCLDHVDRADVKQLAFDLSQELDKLAKARDLLAELATRYQSGGREEGRTYLAAGIRFAVAILDGADPDEVDGL